MKTIDEPMPICEAEMERLEDQLVEDCKSLGMAESIRDFLQEPFSMMIPQSLSQPLHTM